MREGSRGDPPPRVLVIMPGQWPRALTRAALREVGYDAVGAASVGQALRQRAHVAGRGDVRVVVVDQEALTPTDMQALQRLGAKPGGPAMLLVRRPTRAAPAGPWTAVLARPLSVADIVAAVERVCPLPPEHRRPVDLDES